MDEYKASVLQDDPEYSEMLQQQREEEMLRQIELDADFAERLQQAENQPIDEVKSEGN